MLRHFLGEEERPCPRRDCGVPFAGRAEEQFELPHRHCLGRAILGMRGKCRGLGQCRREQQGCARRTNPNGSHSVSVASAGRRMK